VIRDDVGAVLVEAGFSTSDADSRVTLVDRAAASFERRAGRPPQWGWFVPGRIEVFGKHTDYAGGRSLVAAVPRGFAVVGAARDDRILTVEDARWRDAVEIDPGDPDRRFKGWTNYAAVVVRRFAGNFPGAPLGADISIASDLPRAAGLSSSSALVVGLALALIRRGGLEARPEWRAAIDNLLDLAGYLGGVENGLSFRSLEGTSGVGTHGGSEDHTAILNGRAGTLRAFAYVPVRHLADAPLPADWRFIVMSSGIRADKAGSVRGQYNRASLATRVLIDIWRERGGEGVTLGDLVQRPGSADALDRMLEAGRFGDFGAGELRQRLRHFESEDARVPAAVAAFRAGDAAALGDLAAASQRDADLLLGNQIEETRELAALARSAGAFAASSFGAGFGGSVWALAPRDAAAEVAARWHRAYSQVYPATADVHSFVTSPSPGATLLFATE
jgi:galactokinase